MAITSLQLHQMYLAYFARPADFDGFMYYTTNPGADLFSVAAAFSASAESQALYGKEFGAEQVNAIYQHLFNRPAEPDGLAYWLGEISSGRLTPAFAAYAILVGAQNNDALTVQNKLQVAQAFFDHLDTTNEVIHFTGANAAAVARAFLAGVTHEAATRDAALQGIDDAVAEAITPVEDPGDPADPGNPGDPDDPGGPDEPGPGEPQRPPLPNFTHAFTAATDTLVGTDGEAEDVFGGTLGGDAPTVQAGDSADGGGGLHDTLYLVVAEPSPETLDGLGVRNIENVVVRNLAETAVVVDAGRFEGAIAFYSDHSDGTVEFRGLTQGQVGATARDGMTGDSELTFRYADGVGAAELHLGGAEGDRVTIGGAGVTTTTVRAFPNGDFRNELERLTLPGGGVLVLQAHSDLAIRHLSAGAAVAIEVLAGTAHVDLPDLGIAVSRVDASQFGGVIDIHGAADAGFQSDFTYLGGQGRDVYHTRGALQQGSVDGGDEHEGALDELVVHATGHVGAAQAARYTGFEVVRVLDGVEQDLAALAGVDWVVVQDGTSAAGTRVRGLSAAQALNGVRLEGGDSTQGAIALELAADAGRDLQLVVAAGAPVELGGLEVAGVEFLGIHLLQDVSFDGAAGLAQLSELTFSGIGDVDLVTGDTAFEDITLDFSQLVGEVQVDASLATAPPAFFTLRGALAHRNVVSDTAGADNIRLGDRGDAVHYQGGADDYRLMDGGDVFDFDGKAGRAVMGDAGVSFTLDGGESVARAGAIDQDDAYDAALTDTITGIDNASGYTEAGGTRLSFRVEEATAQDRHFVTEAVFGSTALAMGHWSILLEAEGAGSHVAYLFFGRDSGGVVDSSNDLMVRLVGNDVFTQDEFSIVAGLLVFQSA